MCIANRQFCTEFLKKPFLKKLLATEALSLKNSGTD
jgi:hypothetical protein